MVEDPVPDAHRATTPSRPGRLSVLYRTHAGGNAKSRPPWFDRGAALRSLLRATERAGVPVDLTFVVDGEMPAEVRALVRARDRVVVVTGGSASRSFRSCLRVALDLAAGDEADTLYWFAEDDYVYRPEALAQLVLAADTYPEAGYLTLFVPDDSAWHASHPSQPFHDLAPASRVTRLVGGAPWWRTRQTTSTFGVRHGTLVEDAGLLRLGSTVGAPFDAATWVASQRLRPFPWRHIARDLDPHASVRGLAKVPAKPIMRTVLNVVATTRRHPPRILVAPQVDLAMHVEQGSVPAGAGWEDLGQP